MKVTYIGHSGFMIEGKDAVLLFDYYIGEIPKIPSDKVLIVLSSHAHYDHFNPDIFKLFRRYENIRYILSDDILIDESMQKKYSMTSRDLEKIISIGKNVNTSIEIGDLTIPLQTLSSTDEGVAFLLELEGKIIYHAGDLHWWTWIGETEEEYRNMEMRFKGEIEKIKDLKVDLAFTPLDPRQEERFFWGLDYLMTHVPIMKVFPMHCQEDYSVIKNLKEMDLSKPYRNKIMDISFCGQTFLI